MNKTLNLRLQAIREVLKERSVDAVFITNFFNILYLSTIKTLSPEEREAYLVITHDTVYVLSDSRYAQTMKESCDKQGYVFVLITPTENAYERLNEIVQNEKIKRLGFEKEDLKYWEYECFDQLVEVNRVVPIEGLVKTLREQKNDQEIKAIRKACQLTADCLQAVKPLIAIGMSEKELAWKLEQWVREHDYELAFDPIVAIDKNSAIPHYDTKAGTGKITKGSVILIDFGIKYQNYCSDITRMFVMGKPSAQLSNIYEKLLVTQIKTINKISSYTQLVSVDRYCRHLVQSAGLPVYGHGTGHGIGLEVHESPRVSLKSTDQLKAQYVFTIEPGVYLEGEYGMRIEDTVYINDNLQPEVLTNYPKALQIID